MPVNRLGAATFRPSAQSLKEAARVGPTALNTNFLAHPTYPRVLSRDVYLFPSRPFQISKNVRNIFLEMQAKKQLQPFPRCSICNKNNF